uniref:Uncharacterized protein n=1 Tax=Anguilla anguilla TaxID=7936 RepID=A0A0E9S732_ANGAN
MFLSSAVTLLCPCPSPMESSLLPNVHT